MNIKVNSITSKFTSIINAKNLFQILAIMTSSPNGVFALILDSSKGLFR